MNRCVVEVKHVNVCGGSVFIITTFIVCVFMFSFAEKYLITSYLCRFRWERERIKMENEMKKLAEEKRLLQAMLQQAQAQLNQSQ